MKTGRMRAAWTLVAGPRSRNIVIFVLCLLNVAVEFVEAWSAANVEKALLVAVLGTLASVAMLWRRSYPLVVTCIAGACYLGSEVMLPLGFGLLTIAVQRRDRVLVADTAAVALIVMVPTPFSAPRPTDGIGSVISTIIGALLFALFWALWGAYVGARRDLVSTLRERAVRAEHERELKAEQARVAERSRIAREMHDVVAHKVSLIALQAGGLEVNSGASAEQVQQTAGLIRSTAREALQDLREVLGVLRADPLSARDDTTLAPQPGLAGIPALVESSRAAGVHVDLSMSVADLPDTVGRTIYRVVQEAMTNVHKHSRGAATSIAITGRPGEVLVTVTNQRPVAAGSLLPGSGAGLVGLRERVELLGGTLVAGSTPDGGWQVVAKLPVSPGDGRGTGVGNGRLTALASIDPAGNNEARIPGVADGGDGDAVVGGGAVGDGGGNRSGDGGAGAVGDGGGNRSGRGALWSAS